MQEEIEADVNEGENYESTQTEARKHESNIASLGTATQWKKS